MTPETPPTKIGAGLLFVDFDAVTKKPHVLLLRRALSSGNGGTLGLPGGNQDPGEHDLMKTARREAQEEMGENLPQFETIATFKTHRGNRGQKEYTVFVVRAQAGTMGSWMPQLNEEHTEYHWLNLTDIECRADLHPVVRILFDEPLKSAVHKAIGVL